MLPRLFPNSDMLIDTHCHLYLKDLDTEIDDIIQQAHESGVDCMVCPSIDLATVESALLLAHAHPGIYAAAGIHPNYTLDLPDDYLDRLRPNYSQEKVVAVGEIGLDYYWDTVPKEIQQERFEEQISLAKELNLPVIVHNRDADEDVISILKDSKIENGVAHCFSSDYFTAKAFLDLGFYISFAGNLTFKNSHLRDVAKAIPLEKTLVETDSPFLSPMPYRGKRNEPSRTRLVAEQLAQVHDLPLITIAEVTTQNAKTLFSL